MALADSGAAIVPGTGRATTVSGRDSTRRDGAE